MRGVAVPEVFCFLASSAMAILIDSYEVYGYLRLWVSVRRQRAERRMTLTEIGCHSLDEFRLPLSEEVVRARNDAQLFWLGDTCEAAREFVFRSVLVALTLHDQLVFRAACQSINRK